MDNRNKLLDLIFYFIKHNKSVDFDRIVRENSLELKSILINESQLQELINYLIEEKKIIKSENSQYYIHPNAVSFSGYQIEFLKSKIKDKKTTKKDLIFKILPIILAFIFGSFAVYFNFINKEKDVELKEKVREIDSLKKEIKNLTSNLSNPKTK
jgi:hypothetical protein